MTSTTEEIDLTKGTSPKPTPKRKEIEAVKNELDSLIVCIKCPMTFTRNCNYKRHLEYAHSVIETTENKPSSEGKGLSTSKEKLFECTQCSKAFIRHSNLTKHMESHSIHMSYTCEVCNKEFLDLSSLTKHKLVHTEVKSEPTVAKEEEKPDKKDLLYCTICNRNFFYESALEKHKELHLTKEAIFTCSYCPQKFFQKTNLVQHEYTHTRPMHSCYICNKTFNKVYHLKSHLRLHGKSTYTLNCDQCGKSFKSKTSLEVHIRHHAKVPRFRCKGCDAEFSNKTTFIRHMQIKINNSTKYRCEYCGKICCHKKNLDSHLVTHSIGNISFRCNQCQQDFVDKYEFQNHMYSHVTVKTKFSCDSCNAIFSSEINLYRHRNADDGTDLKCINCKRTFKCSRALKQHYCTVETQANRKKFEMDENFIDRYAEELLEASTYKTPPNKIKHRDHTYSLPSWPAKPYKCKKCGKHFCRLVNLEKHIQEIHPFYLSAESSEENSEEESSSRKETGFVMPKIASVTSLQMENEQVFVSDDNAQDQVVDHDEQLVDPLLLDYQQNHKESEMETNHVQGTSRSTKNIVKIEPNCSEEEMQQFNKARGNEFDVIDIKQEVIDYESS